MLTLALPLQAAAARDRIEMTGSFGVEGAAIEGLCRSLASELSPQGIRVICLRSAGSPESFPETTEGGAPLGIIFEDFGSFYPDFAAEMGGWLKAGKVHYREEIIDGLEKAPATFIGMLNGNNFGKCVIRVGPSQ